LENFYEKIEKEKALISLPSEIKSILIKEKEKALFWKKMIQLENKVEIDFDLKSCEFGNYNEEKAIETLKELEFFSLISKLPKKEKSAQKNLTLW